MFFILAPILLNSKLKQLNVTRNTFVAILVTPHANVLEHLSMLHSKFSAKIAQFQPYSLRVV